jgi:hypothetical protein
MNDIPPFGLLHRGVLQEAQEYYGLAIDYFAKMQMSNAIHSLAGGVRRI